jgi:hypothetical protein
LDVLFPRTFLLVFAQIAVGGMFCLSIPPFQAMERGYYKSSAFVFWFLGTLATDGHFALWRRAGASVSGGVGPVELALWSAFCVFAGAYLASLWREYVVLRARLFAACWAIGMSALVVGASSFAVVSPVPLATIVYPLSFILAALVLGTTASGMLLGHWYLIDRDLPLAPLWSVLRFYVLCLAAQAITLAAGSVLMSMSAATYAAAWHEYRWVFLGRVAISPLGTAILAAMIWRTLLIPQTMAATGLFYIAVLGATVGEILGRYLLFRTGLPL